MSRKHLNPVDSNRSPYPVRRRTIGPQSRELGRSMPAITLLSPDAYYWQDTMSPRPLSPGGYRMAPPRSAKNKMMSFVILNENLTSPVTSRAPSPSGRVSPFRGHGFKSPTTSRPNSRSPSPVPPKIRRHSVVVPIEASKPAHIDIGLPPKSPKRALKNVHIKEFKPQKPTLKPKPLINKGDLKGNVEKRVKIAGNPKAMIMSTANNKNDKKAPPKKPAVSKKPDLKNPEVIPTCMSDLSDTKATEDSNQPIQADLPTTTEISSTQETDDPVVVSEPESKAEKPKDESENKDEKLIPCFQPDKCYIVPPTMASPSLTVTSTTTVLSTSTNRVSSSRMSAITSALSMTDSLSKKSLGLRSKQNLLPPPSPLSEISAKETPSTVVTLNDSPARIEPIIATMTTVDEILKSRASSAASRSSEAKLSAVSPTLSIRTRSSMVTVRAASNGSLRTPKDDSKPGEEISSTRIISAGPDLEVLSPNNLMESPPENMQEPLWNGDRLPNGASGAGEQPQGRCRRFFAALCRLLTYLFCCCKRCTCCQTKHFRLRCCSKFQCKSSRCCKKSTPTPSEQKQSKCSSCRQCSPCSFFSKCFSKLNCCKSLKCSSCCKSNCCKSNCCKSNCCKKLSCSKCSPCCKKLKCCEGKKCCKRTSTSSASKMCCAKPSCNCKECCAKVKECCLSCNDKVNNCCRALFCLNLICCQRCLKKCRCCHKLKCCKKGGCCSCCNPYVKREQRQKLDKKTSRASNQSKQERAKLDSALVEHASMMKAAIPVLPSCLAWFCLFLNLFIPGSGTFMSGILCLCFGKPRFSVNDSLQNRVSSFFVNFVIAISQAFTIIFCLVGWGWSVWWGVIMVKLARKQKRLKIAEKNQEAAPSNANQNHVDPERN